MQKRILFIGFVLIILLIGLAYSETTTTTPTSPPTSPNTNSNIISDLKKSSSGVSFSDNGFGGVKIIVDSTNNKISYRDMHGNSYELSGLIAGSLIELDSNGNMIRGNFAASKSLDIVLGGNLKVNVPANSVVKGVDGKNFDVNLASGTGAATPPTQLYPNENNGGNIINFKTTGKSNVKFPDFNLQEGTISHNGKNYILRGGNTATINGLSLYTLTKQGDNPIYFDQTKVPADLKNGYSVFDFKKGYAKLDVGNGNSRTINFQPGNTIAPVSDKNKFGIKADGQMGVQNGKATIYPYVQGKFVVQNGNLYLYRQQDGLVGSFNNQNGNYEVIPVDMSIKNPDGSVLLRDKDGNALGLMVRQGQNGWPQVQTSPVQNPLNPSANPTPTPNPNAQEETPNWQHNPDAGSTPVDSPITPSSTPIQNSPSATAPSSKYPFTKEQFYRDIFSAPTSTLVRGLGYGPNLGVALQTVDPALFQKHFGAGSTTTIDEALSDYKALINTKAPEGSWTRSILVNLAQSNQKGLYDTYAGALGFPPRKKE